ncbi:MAG: protein kinase domain-containing protein [Planctomycetota bacterium]|jgi:serine/threonine-protein kinase
MSDAKEKNGRRPGEDEAPPTASFSNSVPGPGGQIGPFRIEGELGRGAVGVVYLAHDTKLDRSVAIKSLPAEVMANPKARSRFTREARVLASLNHPNIATIYEEFQETEDVAYLILEYIPGQTLAERIAKGSLKLEDSLTIALQIAEAVAAAHEHDVIHRDLKPGNIKITPEGKVKVLDFGLAKAVGGEALDEQSTVTEPGRVIGTPAYMSPEQARGQVTDKRSDIWSFGCILYEMLTATIPFKGETISDTLANILQTEPRWEALPKSTPSNIVVLLHRCLKKNPRRRLRDIGDAGIEISEALTHPLSVSVESHPSRRASWKAAALCASVGLVVGVIAMLLVMRGPIQPSEPRHVGRYSITLDPENPFRLYEEAGSPPVFTPDGRQLIYVARTGRDSWLVARPLDSLDAQRIRGTQDASWPQVSPDGRWLAFLVKGSIWRVSLAGGTPEQIADDPSYFSYIWEDNDTLIINTKNPGTDGLSRFNLRTQESEPLTSLDDTPGHNIHLPIRLHQESRTVFFIAMRGLSVDNSILFAMSLKSRQLKPLMEHAAGWYAPSGHLIYVQKGRLMAAPFDIKTLRITGSAANVTEDRMAKDEALPAFAFSPKGTLVYAPLEGSQERSRELVWVGLEGQEKLLGTRPMRYTRVRVSGDTARPQVAVEVSRDYGIWIYDTGGASPIRRLTFPSEGGAGCPIWTPDNREILFGSRVSDSFVIKRKATDGSGEAEVLSVNASGWRSLWPYARTPDGKELVARAVSSEETSTGMDIVAVHLERDGEVEPLLVSDDDEHFAALSPDGKWLAYVSDELGRDDVFVTGFPGLKGKWHVSTETEGGQEPVWAPDGTAIYYRDGASLVTVSVVSESGFSLGRARSLFEDVYVPRPSSRNYDIHPDGKQFLMIKRSEEEFPMTELIVVENWFEELKRLVPTGKDL